MKLIKLQNLSNRPITSSELMTRYIFGDKFPKAFIAGTKYVAGDNAYIINESGSLTIYTCLVDGIYHVIDSTNWDVAELPHSIQSFVDDYMATHNFAGGSIDTEELRYLIETLIKTSNDHQFITLIGDDIDFIDNHSVKLPFKYDENLYHIDIYVDRIRLNADEYTITNRTINTTKTINETNTIITILNKCTRESRLLYRFETVATDVVFDSEYTVYISIPPIYLEKSLVFDLYYNGKYISEKHYSFTYDATTGTYAIILTSDIINKYGIDSLEPEYFRASVLASLSKQISIIKNDIDISSIMKVDNFQLDLKYRDFANIGSMYNCYDNGLIIPNTVTELYNNTVHITDNAYYMATDNFVISYKNIVLNSVYEFDTDLSNNYNESVVVTERQSREKKIPVPFVKYDKNINNLLVFKAPGYYISSSRYYIDDDYMLSFYPHENDISEGDIIHFQIIGDDSSIGSYIKSIVFTDTDIENGVKLPCLDFESDKFDLMVFNRDGHYIPSEDYILSETNWFSFNGIPKITRGTALEFVCLEYQELRTDTVVKRYRTKVRDNDTLALPFVYIGNTDSFFILRKDGMYVDKSHYTVSSEGNITLLSGTEFTVGENIDIFLFRKLDSNPLTTRIPKIKNDMV